jgi:O-acetyl-ADP-ribose deacetylase (regulator of RNase III)
MALKYIKKDVTTVTCGIVGHGCNTKGIMGAGVAFAIKRKWKNAYNEYNTLCKNYALNTKDMLGMVQIVPITDVLKIGNCFTQNDFGHDGRVYASINAVTEALESLVVYAEFEGLPVYIPRIGCGLGGLKYEQDVQPILECLTLEYPNVDIFVCDIA